VPGDRNAAKEGKDMTDLTDAPKSAAPPRRRRKDARPAEIVEAAFKVFCAHGYGKARVDEVAREAGIAKGTVYLYFPNKQALFQAVIEAKVSAALSRVGDLVDGFEGPTEALLRGMLRQMYENIVLSDTRLLMRIIIGEGHQFPEIRTLYYDKGIRPGMTVLDRVVQRGIDRGEFRDGPIREFPRLVMAPGLMAAIWGMTFAENEPIDMDRYFEGHLDLVLNGLKA
jgi:AcrR family transcriptional regulator